MFAIRKKSNHSNSIAFLLDYLHEEKSARKCVIINVRRIHLQQIIGFIRIYNYIQGYRVSFHFRCLITDCITRLAEAITVFTKDLICQLILICR